MTQASAVQQIAGRWFITMGNAGFNSRANNGRGYVSEAAALAAIAKYEAR